MKALTNLAARVSGFMKMINRIIVANEKTIKAHLTILRLSFPLTITINREITIIIAAQRLRRKVNKRDIPIKPIERSSGKIIDLDFFRIIMHIRVKNATNTTDILGGAIRKIFNNEVPSADKS
jgi:hypothetical protein